ncbi:MAG: helix-turn-helix transcriptional regulator [Chthoniobacterales bacterium]|nr:helix-turn-helix transcriptional regulator [Chthoniobacterales bacterium]
MHSCQRREYGAALFSRHGFAAVSIERIAEKAETSPVTIYRHFGTMDRIVI